MATAKTAAKSANTANTATVKTAETKAAKTDAPKAAKTDAPKQPSADKSSSQDGELKKIAYDLIDRNPNQPRKTFEDSYIKELAQSIAEVGLLQEIIVVERNGHYMIVAGERRWRAIGMLINGEHAHLFKDGVNCKVVQLTDEEVLVFAIIENMQRRDITKYEEAVAFGELRDKFGMTHQQIAQRVGIKQAHRVRDRLLLLNLTVDERKEIETKLIHKDGKVVKKNDEPQESQLNWDHAFYIAQLEGEQRKKYINVARAGRANSLSQTKTLFQQVKKADETARVDQGSIDGAATLGLDPVIAKDIAKFIKSAESVGTLMSDLISIDTTDFDAILHNLSLKQLDELKIIFDGARKSCEQMRNRMRDQSTVKAAQEEKKAA